MQARVACMLAAFVVLALTMAVSFRTTHHEDGPPVTRSGWLRLHPPRQARHDNELLRRRMLMSIAELPPQDLTQHVPQLIACLGHNDRHVRELALGLLRKMPASALADRTTSLVQLLAQGNSDDAIRLYVLHSLVGECRRSPTFCREVSLSSTLTTECKLVRARWHEHERCVCACVRACRLARRAGRHANHCCSLLSRLRVPLRL